MAKASTKPGRGRKQCNGRKLYVGVRCKTCSECGHEFENKAPKAPKAPKGPRKITTFDGPGPGRKQCKDCGTYVAARTSICLCGSDFRAARVKVVRTGPTDQETEVATTNIETPETGGSGNRRIKGNHVIHTPAGKCPIDLDGTDTDTVIAWAKAVQAKEADTLSVNALDYWSRTQGIGFGTDEHKAIKAGLAVYAQEVGLVG